MDMKHIGTLKGLLKQFPLIKMIPQVMELLNEFEEKEFWIFVKKGEIFIGKEGSVLNGNEEFQKRG